MYRCDVGTVLLVSRDQQDRRGAPVPEGVFDVRRGRAAVTQQGGGVWLESGIRLRCFLGFLAQL